MATGDVIEEAVEGHVELAQQTAWVSFSLACVSNRRDEPGDDGELRLTATGVGGRHRREPVRREDWRLALDHPAAR